MAHGCVRFRGDEAQAGAEWDAHAHAHARAGSDDGMVCVYEHRAGVGSTLLGGDGPSLENWRTSRVLRAHSNNVVDLCWSPDDSRLATASIDNTVVVWDMATGRPLRTLDGHSSFVKGVAWDPVGTYLATQV